MYWLVDDKCYMLRGLQETNVAFFRGVTAQRLLTCINDGFEWGDYWELDAQIALVYLRWAHTCLAEYEII